jgi:hypothetical protein
VRLVIHSAPLFDSFYGRRGLGLHASPGTCGWDGSAKAILADTGYDADDVVKAAEFRGAEGAMASKSNRKNPRHFDKVLYRKPNFIEILLREYSINSRISVMLPPVTIQQPQLVLLLSWSQAFAYGLNNMSTCPIFKSLNFFKRFIKIDGQFIDLNGETLYQIIQVRKNTSLSRAGIS